MYPRCGCNKCVALARIQHGVMNRDMDLELRLCFAYILAIVAFVETGLAMRFEIVFCPCISSVEIGHFFSTIVMETDIGLEVLEHMPSVSSAGILAT